MKNDQEIIGFDLGHGETAVALAMMAATTEPQIIDIQGSKSILTAVAQHPVRGVLIGDDAYLARNVTSLRIAFKSPEVDRPDVREPTKLFVGKILDILLQDRKISGGDISLFFVGCPSGWNAVIRDSYAALLREAGMRQVTVWPESRAALVYARESGYISQELAEGAILIVDIGSSTTDFTAVQNLEIRISDFGQNALGGGLIDKAMLEHTLVTHPRAKELRKIFTNHPVYAAICELECRKVKEMFFSNPDMWQDKPASKTVRLETNPPLYIDVEMTPAVMDKLLATPLPQLNNQSWQAAFHDALVHARERMQDSLPQLVLLTGGASRMGFTSDLCQEIFSAARVVRGAEPEFAIARGLAGAGRIELKTKAFREEVGELINSGKVRHAVEDSLPVLIDAVARFLARSLPNTVILPAFREWQAGQLRTLYEMEQAVQPLALDWLARPEGKQQLGAVIQRWFLQMLPGVERLTNPICDRYRVPQTAMNLPAILGIEGVTGLPKGMISTEAVLGGVSNIVSVLGAILITSALGGGGGIALLTHGPVGVVMLIAIGGATWYLGKVGLDSLIKNIDLPTFIRSFVSESRVQNALQEREADFAQEIREVLVTNRQAFTELLDAIHDSIKEALFRAADRAALLIR
ncbi:MAG: Hsp70 family protein [Candidatus Binatia bacterium]